ncbi:unnamed protein product [Phytophthora fragariaefolia]|uniref:Unnamed protein product n=1 Tax=Phytophthora fragariaefolia TaxID=1490495 RepID=A0A9W6X9D0_9STRA|nr:unnamed protein product [Phytophthora fragariaefolia]
MIGNSKMTTSQKKQREAALRATEWTPVMLSEFEIDMPSYPNLGEQKALPVAELRALSSSPLQTFLYSMPKSLWVLIAQETNRYLLQQLEWRAQCIMRKQCGREIESLKKVRRRLKLKNGYELQEILHVIGILVARMMYPQKHRLLTTGRWSRMVTSLPATLATKLVIVAWSNCANTLSPSLTQWTTGCHGESMTAKLSSEECLGRINPTQRRKPGIGVDRTPGQLGVARL